MSSRSLDSKVGNRLALLAVFVAVALVAATAIALMKQQREREQVEKTLKNLSALASYLQRPRHIYVSPLSDEVAAVPKTTETSNDPTGQLALQRLFWVKGDTVPSDLSPFFDGTGLALDGWGRPLKYRCPGTKHPTGWDLYSFGPNGIDESGDGDDLLVGDAAR